MKDLVYKAIAVILVAAYLYALWIDLHGARFARFLLDFSLPPLGVLRGLGLI